jgi:hypothetical protein
MPTTAVRRQETLLQVLIHQRHLTREGTIKLLERRATELGVEDFALSVRQLDRWLAGQIDTLPRPSLCRVVEAEFGRPIGQLLALHDGGPLVSVDATKPQANTELRTEEMVLWLADHSDKDLPSLWHAVAAEAARMAATPGHERAEAEHRRSSVSRAQISDAVASYYGSPPGLYKATVSSGENLTLSVLSRPEWLGVSIPLGGDSEQVTMTATRPDDRRIVGAGLDGAIRRLAATETSDTVMVNDLLYSLQAIDIGEGRLAARFALVDFAAYALTNDLLEDELVNSLTRRSPWLPLRSLYLPSAEMALEPGRRLCVGGPVCLTAIARPAGDFALIVQQRSSRVVNVAGRLAVIPKAFHQPIVDASGEVLVSATVERELEEELLGRLDLEPMGAAAGRRVAPHHELALSEPAAWLRANPDRWALECTAFGINLVTGNYELSCLLVIDDEEWWKKYGHRVEANWEAKRLQTWSSTDTAAIAGLVADPRWSNEGLFAFLEGLRRLAIRSPERSRVPTIEVEVS